MGYPWLALLLPLRTYVPPLSKRALMTVKLMANVGYPWLAILLMTNMLLLVTPSKTVLLAKHILLHTVTLLTIQGMLIRFQMLQLQHRNPFKLSTPPRIQTMMTRKSIRPAASRELKMTVHPSTKTTNNPAEDNHDCLHVPLDDSDIAHYPAGRDKDASPPKRIKYSEAHPYAIISLFDGVGSAIPAITKAFGCAPRIVIAAECDPILRQIVGEQFLFRTDGKWT